MNENWRETLPNPASVSYRNTQQQRRAQAQAEEMRRALAGLDDSPKRRREERGDERRFKASKVAMWVLVAFLIFAAGFAALRVAPDVLAKQKEATETDTEPRDGSNAGANAVTLEDLQGNAEEEYSHGWQSLTGYAPSWDVVSEGDGVTVSSASDGPFYDLPMGWTSFTIHDRDSNRSYTVICTDVGTIAVVPTLDDTGAQVITEHY